MRIVMGALAACVLNSAYAAEDANGFNDRQVIAKETLRWLQGEWRFTLGAQSGLRVVEAAYPDHLISWRETFDEIDIEGQGYIGYAPAKDQFYTFSAHNVAGEFGMMLGEMNEHATKITYRSAIDSSPAYQVIWQKLDDNHFSYSLYEELEEEALEKRWTAVFTRME